MMYRERKLEGTQERNEKGPLFNKKLFQETLEKQNMLNTTSLYLFMHGSTVILHEDLVASIILVIHTFSQ